MKADSIGCTNRIDGGAFARRRLAAIALLLTFVTTGGFFGCRSVNQNAPAAAATPELAAVPSPAPTRHLPEKIPVMRFPPRYEAELKKSINADLNTWRKTIEARDADKHVEHYADEIETYYQASNVGKDFIRDDRRRAFERFDTLKVQLINIDVYLESKDAATVVFDKTWDFKSAANFSNGLVQQEIKMRRIEKEWLIVSEKDLEIYRYRNQ